MPFAVRVAPRARNWRFLEPMDSFLSRERLLVIAPHADDKNHKVEGNSREEELAAAMEVLGVDDWEILIRDSDLHLRLDHIPRRDLVNLFERERSEEHTSE